jgi:hypothetical protein
LDVFVEEGKRRPFYLVFFEFLIVLIGHRCTVNLPVDQLSPFFALSPCWKLQASNHAQQQRWQQQQQPACGRAHGHIDNDVMCCWMLHLE